MLLHLIDGTSEHAGQAYKTVRGELEAYGAGLSEKLEIVALTKIDALDAETLKKQRERLRRAMRADAASDASEGTRPLLLLSAVSGAGVPEALRMLLSIVDSTRTLSVIKEPVAWHPKA